MGKDSEKPAEPFPLKKSLKSSIRAGIWGAASGGGCAAPSGELLIIAFCAAVGFACGAAGHLHGEWEKHRNDDPSPVFDRGTTFLFDAAGTVVGLGLLFVPALMLDHQLRPDAPLPGFFGFAAIYLISFLMPVLRGLLINLGLVRDAEDERLRG